jgi:hypothetical protein
MEIEKLIIDPEIDMVLFDHIKNMNRHKYMTIYGKVYEVEFTENALLQIKRDKLDKKKLIYRESHPKKEPKVREKKNYYLMKKMAESQRDSSNLARLEYEAEMNKPGSPLEIVLNDMCRYTSDSLRDRETQTFEVIQPSFPVQETQSES